MWSVWFMVVLGACGPDPAAAEHAGGGRAPVVLVSAPWQVVSQDDAGLTLRFADTPHGVRVDLALTGRTPRAGVRPIVDGRRVPTLAPMMGVSPRLGAVRGVTVTSEGHDLVVKFEGPPLDEVSTNAVAPRDPAIAWMRLRPRNGSWRLVSTGLVVWQVTATRAVVTSEGVTLVGREGTWAFGSLPRVRTWRQAGDLLIDTGPGLDDAAPYPRLGVTWRPDGDGGQPLTDPAVSPSTK